MNQLTEEQQQRLNKLRDLKEQAIRAAIDNYEFRPLPRWGDIDFLLSLLDSQAAGDREAERVAMEGIKQGLRQRDERAATSMRDKCVEKLYQVRDNHLVSNNEHYEKGFNAALKCAELAMRSLTLDTQEKPV